MYTVQIHSSEYTHWWETQRSGDNKLHERAYHIHSNSAAFGPIPHQRCKKKQF